MKPLLPTLSIMVTYQCNIECRHCGPRCSPRQTEWITVDEMKDLIDQAANLGTANVVFTGGEPSLLGKQLPLLLRYVKDVGIQMTRVVSNGKWATTYDRAHEQLRLWREAGLDEINISCGEYHQEFVPISSVANAYQAAKDLGYTTVLLAGEFVKDSHATVTPADFERAVGEVLLDPQYASPYTDRFEGMTCGRALRQGRGKTGVPVDAVELADQLSFKGVCREVSTSITVHPDGNVTACCGVAARDESLLAMGNWREQRLAPLLEQANRDLILNWMRYLGLHDMKRWLEDKQPSLSFQSKYASMCDLCVDLTSNPEAQQMLIHFGAERSAEIVAAKIAIDAVEYQAEQFSY